MRHFTHKHSFFTLLIICLALGYKKLSNSAFVGYNEPGSYRIQALNIPTEIQFAGESMQLTETDLIERMDKELLVNTYWQSNTILMGTKKQFNSIDRQRNRSSIYYYYR